MSTTKPPELPEPHGKEHDHYRLLYGFILDCNAIGPEEAGRNLARSLKEATAALAHKAGVQVDDAIEQALTDPENQPSQWGTIPLAMLPPVREVRHTGLMDSPDDHDEWQEMGYDYGWNACLAAIDAALAHKGNEE